MAHNKNSIVKLRDKPDTDETEEHQRSGPFGLFDLATGHKTIFGLFKGVNDQDNDAKQADEDRWAKIFSQLDRNGNGRIDVHDLSAALKDFGMSHQYAEVIRFHQSVKLSLMLSVRFSIDVSQAIGCQ